jgi:soluble lytic murein transglycosylase-like protein
LQRHAQNIGAEVKQHKDRRDSVPSALLTVCLIISALFGCSSESFVPGTARSLPAGMLDALVATAARAHTVSPRLISAVIAAESHGDPSAISRAGAEGIMQLMPATALQYGIVNPFDPAQNIEAGTHYLHDLLRRYRGNVKLALAAYNAGPGAVDAAHGIPAFAETRAYVARVVAQIPAS